MPVEGVVPTRRDLIRPDGESRIPGILRARRVASARAAAVAGGALVAASLVGGAVSVAAGVNRWSNAWTSEATLAAPWPMLVVQTAATVAAAQAARRPARIGSAVLVLSAAVSGISGFFDGQLARPDLGAGYVLAQVGYVVVAWLAVAAGVVRLVAIRSISQSPPVGDREVGPARQADQS